MAEELNLVKDLAIILIAAGVFTIISKALKQPLILGYIIAGFVISPQLGLPLAVSGMESVHQWSELGIIFLLFCLGLEFSFKKLLKVGSSALITAVTQCIGMFIIGIVTGNAMGWSSMEGIFLGGMLSVSSTSIIIKAYTDMGYKDKPFSSLVFGTLVVQDLIAVLLLVLLNTIAVSNKFEGGEMVMNLAKLAFFMILWFLVGIFVIPTILKRARKYLNDEILLLISVGLCFTMVVLANLAGFSNALGAFVMGSILAGTSEGEHIENLLHSVKDLFSAIFFVSVGMMINPAVIAEHWLPILILTIVAVGGILLFSTTGALLAGKGLDIAVHTGFSLSQIGEFSFIIAGLGVSLGVVSGFVYPVIIAVSVITTFTTPYMIKAADPATKWLEKTLPAKFLERINPQAESRLESAAEKNEWKGLITSYVVRIVLYGVILIAILMGSRMFLHGFVIKMLPSWSDSAHNFLTTGITLVVMMPFLYGMAVTNGSISKHAKHLLERNAANRWPILSLMTLRIFLATGFMVGAISQHFKLAGWALPVVILAGFCMFFFSKFSVKKFSGLESRFMQNFNEKEILARESSPFTTSVAEMMSCYDVHLETMTISPDFSLIGQKLRDMPFRNESDVNIIKLQRGSHVVIIPSGDEVLYPGDLITAVGTGEQLLKFRNLVSENVIKANTKETEFTVQSSVLNEESYLCGKTLREASMRNAGCMVISVLHDGQLITNPKADFRFSKDDVIWLAGEKASCEWYM